MDGSDEEEEEDVDKDDKNKDKDNDKNKSTDNNNKNSKSNTDEVPDPNGNKVNTQKQGSPPLTTLVSRVMRPMYRMLRNYLPLEEVASLPLKRRHL